MSGPGEYQEMAASVPPALKAITLTHVRYHRGDRVGLFLAWVSLVPVFISLGGFVSHFMFRRELQGICFAAGLLVSQVLNELIKHSVAQSRPASCELLETCDSHGWPSSHAQYTFFFATYLSLFVLRRSPASRVMAAFTWPLAFLTMLSRVYLGYHTVPQVFAGAVVGLVFGAIWYWFANTILAQYFPMIEESAIGRWFYIKDTSHIQDVLKFEYDNARAARKKVATD
ncbi:Dolichyldiphosphatase 1 [Hordeum vulgare]|uniref:Phosphatidic acid phosphatase type 2/haloperoxidase domain-containing protein n=1 Tax=Hordeum vulgare subsp. vulgare TaxID=112509 RepID=A0A287P759_HORVV|nr:lipid phosphate phosphatase gamma [Hordeum vulgare subsp. vulgare]XP_044981912.1 lipid phosphate phosphatase gamma [Hordeum vulgare subsp. vulgare]KAE8796325.1 Dolichyldiphosphatase 1 [Hordeum vulgare]